MRSTRILHPTPFSSLSIKELGPPPRHLRTSPPPLILALPPSCPPHSAPPRARPSASASVPRAAAAYCDKRRCYLDRRPSSSRPHPRAGAGGSDNNNNEGSSLSLSRLLSTRKAHLLVLHFGCDSGSGLGRRWDHSAGIKEGPILKRLPYLSLQYLSTV